MWTLENGSSEGHYKHISLYIDPLAAQWRMEQGGGRKWWACFSPSLVRMGEIKWWRGRQQGCEWLLVPWNYSHSLQPTSQHYTFFFPINSVHPHQINLPPEPLLMLRTTGQARNEVCFRYSWIDWDQILHQPLNCAPFPIYKSDGRNRIYITAWLWGCLWGLLYHHLCIVIIPYRENKAFRLGKQRIP